MPKMVGVVILLTVLPFCPLWASYDEYDASWNREFALEGQCEHGIGFGAFGGGGENGDL